MTSIEFSRLPCEDDFELKPVSDLVDLLPPEDGPLEFSYAIPLRGPSGEEQTAVLHIAVRGPGTLDFYTDGAVGLLASRVVRTTERSTHDGLFVLTYLENGDVLVSFRPHGDCDLLPHEPGDTTDDAEVDESQPVRFFDVSCEVDGESESGGDRYAVWWIVDPTVKRGSPDHWDLASRNNKLEVKTLRQTVSIFEPPVPKWWKQARVFQGFGKKFVVSTTATRLNDKGERVAAEVTYKVIGTRRRGVQDPD